MSADALTFMLACWTGVLGLAGWSLYRVVRAQGRRRPAEPGSHARPGGLL